MILPIYIYGNPVLRETAKDIDADYPQLETLIQNMQETLAASGGIGLAAPQVGKSIRLSVIDLDDLSDDLPEYKGFNKVYINPHILDYGDETDSSEEGCLSLPGIHEKVVRPKRILVRYTDTDWQVHEEWVEGYLARVMQHEFDHLDAHLFIDRVSPLRKQLIKNKLKAMKQGRYQCDYRTKQ